MTRRPLWPAVLIGWGLAAAVFCLLAAPAIAGLFFPDPDDAMRLLEVRDWLAGQGWWDVGQHRLNGGDFPMHWSRLVDLPLAAAMALADPLAGIALSNRIAMTIVPLATLLAVMALVASITRRVAGDEAARLAVLLVPLAPVLVFQLRPMRIDHHGWQIVLALAAVRLLLGRWTVRAGALAGLALGALLTISLEGMPIAVAIVAVAAVGWALDPRCPEFLAALGASFAGSALTLHVLTRGPGMLAPVCDAMSPAWLGALGVAGFTLAAASLLSRRPMAVRFAALAVGGVASLALLWFSARPCLAGPFAALDPLVKALWYDQVDEGLPIWRQRPSVAALVIGLPIVGLVGTFLSLKRARGIAWRRWAILGAILVAAVALSCFVFRAGATANALAVPGAAVVAVTLLRRARAVRSVTKRIAATAGALLVVSPGVAAGGWVSMGTPGTPAASRQGGPAARAVCRRFADIRGLAVLPPTTIFAPLDVTPDLIATTRHRAVAGGYHRNAAAMHRVAAAFTADPDTARALVQASGASILAVCPGLNEPDLYAQVAPRGLWARLARGERIGWLAPIALPGSPVLAWRVAAPPARRPAP